ncbi:MAG: glycosyltransferase, partial [Oricola sp.]|nr:glycosyltransferase [Oricola sp.]
GWVGGRVNLCQLERLGPVLQRLAKKHDIELRVLSNESVEIPGVRVTHVPWALDIQEQEVAAFDIGVMPLPPSKHAEGKCAYKALQYMAAAVPVVASDVGINKEVVIPEQAGFIARTLEDFEPALETLITDPELRKKLGQEGRALAVQSYSVEIVGARLANILKRNG